jgi:hypothetical protein
MVIKLTFGGSLPGAGLGNGWATKLGAKAICVFTLALTCVLSPGERISPVMLSVARRLSGQPSAGVFLDAGNVKALSSEERVG